VTPADLANCRKLRLGLLLKVVAIPAGFEPATHGVENLCRFKDINGLLPPCYYRVASTTERGLRTRSRKSCSRSLRITGHRSTGTPLEASTPSSANTASPDPAAVTPSWGSDNDLWITALMARSGGSTTLVSAYPSGYGSNQNESTSNNRLGTTAAVATKTAIATSDNPAAFTLAGARESVAVTIAVRPA
jgi:hypothetical protein